MLGRLVISSIDLGSGLEFGSFAHVLAVLTQLFDLKVHLGAGLLDTDPVIIDLKATLVVLSLALSVLHVELELRIRGRLRLELLHGADRLLDDRRERREGVRGRLNDRLGGLCEHPVEGLTLLGGLQTLHGVTNVLIGRTSPKIIDLGGIPQGHMLLDVVQNAGNVGRSDQFAHTQSRIDQIGEVGLQVGEVILLREGHNRTTHRRGDVLVHRVLHLGRHFGVQKVLAVLNLQHFEDALLDLALIIHPRNGSSPLSDGLNLCKPLGLAENVRVRDRNHVHRTIEVLAGRNLLANFLLDILVVEIHGVQTVENPQHPRH